MKTIRYILLFIPLFLAACTSEDIVEPDTGNEGNVTFTFNAGGELTTRTTLEGAGNKQHAEYVYLYVFNGQTDNATCTQVKNMPWPKPEEVGYTTTTRTYSINLPAGDYTFLAIGLDNAAGATYGLPSAIAAGSKLADAKATLASGKTKEDIAQSELFAGHVTASIKESGNDPVTITLYRRVAGVMGWFKNVPANVAKIQISLYTGQNKQGYLIKQAEGTEDPSGITNPNNFKDFITAPISAEEESKILVSINVPAGTTAEQVLSGGSYVLPAAAPIKIEPDDTYPDEDDPRVGTEYTLRVELIGADGTTIKTQRVRMQEGDDLYIPEFVDGGSGTAGYDLGGPFRFPIVANRFYGIGTALTPIDLGGGGEDIVITVNPDWLVIEPTIPLE